MSIYKFVNIPIIDYGIVVETVKSVSSVNLRSEIASHIIAKKTVAQF